MVCVEVLVSLVCTYLLIYIIVKSDNNHTKISTNWKKCAYLCIVKFN